MFVAASRRDDIVSYEDVQDYVWRLQECVVAHRQMLRAAADKAPQLLQCCPLSKQLSLRERLSFEQPLQRGSVLFREFGSHSHADYNSVQHRYKEVGRAV